MTRHILALYCLLSAVVAWSWDTPTMGWSSWNTYRNNISGHLIKEQAREMCEKGLREAGYIYVNIDDGAFDGRDDDGNLNINLKRFPEGMKPLVDYIHSMGLRAGTYSDAGRNTCASYYDNDKGGVGTGLYGHDIQDMRFLLNDIGFDFIKVDFCGGDNSQNSESLDLDERQRYSEIRAAIDSTGRSDVRFNVCRWNYPGTWVDQVASSWRISEDIWLGWESVKGIIGQNLYLSAYASKGRYNDMDMLEVGRGLSPEEDKTHFGMWCIMSSPLLIGCDLTTLSEESLSLLKNPELLALNQDPLALQAYVAQYSDSVYVLVKDIKNPYSVTRAVAVYNPTDSTRTVTLDFTGIDLAGKIKVRDVFERTDKGTFEQNMAVEVPAHATRIYTLEGEKRLERKRYEAETGRLSAYQEIDNHKAVKSAVYEASPICSGGMKASWLGQAHGNDIVWNNIYSKDGGEYMLDIAWISGEPRGLTIDVNGTTLYKVHGDYSGCDTVRHTFIPIHLDSGENTIRLYNGEDWMPDIDYVDIVKK